MKRIKALTEEEQVTLLEAARHAPESRFRQRAHAVYLNNKGYRLDQLAEIFGVDRDTASIWLVAWEKQGLMGLRDRPHPGRPRRCTESDLIALETELEKAPHQSRRLPAWFQERTGKPVALSTVCGWLKKRHWVWKRCRRSVKKQCDPARFAEGQRTLQALLTKEAAGEIDVFFMDESGFRADSCVPYAWQRQGETQALPANTEGRMNVIGWMSRQGQSHFHQVTSTVTSVSVVEAMEKFIQSRPADKLTVVVMDNAPPHRKAVREKQSEWLLGRVWVWFLPPYAPELNLIEILWKHIKYEWLPWDAYSSFEALQDALADIFQNLGGKYRINFA